MTRFRAMLLLSCVLVGAGCARDETGADDRAAEAADQVEAVARDAASRAERAAERAAEATRRAAERSEQAIREASGDTAATTRAPR